MKLYWAVMLFCPSLRAGEVEMRDQALPVLDHTIVQGAWRDDNFSSTLPSPTETASHSDCSDRSTGRLPSPSIKSPVQFSCPYCNGLLELFVGSEQCHLAKSSSKCASCRCTTVEPTQREKIKDCCDRTALILGYTLPPVIIGVLWWAYHTPAQSCYNH